MIRHEAKTTLHAGLVSVAGNGLLILGESGTGKSELALRLLACGHKLVADDVVEIVRRDDALFGSAPGPLGGIVEVRGLGLLNVKALYGDRSVIDQSRINLIVKLVDAASERQQNSTEILGVNLPVIALGARMRRDWRLFAETANRVARRQGILVGVEQISHSYSAHG